MKTTAVALALAVGGLSAPISSPLTGTDPAAAERRVVTKRVVKRRNGNRIVTDRVVVRRPGVRVIDGRYWYGDRYYDHDEALATGLIGFAAGAIVGGALAAPAPIVVAPAPVVGAPVLVGVPEPYSDAWYAECDAKYESFDYDSGTFLDYDGEPHLCQLP
jgi:hypothetical protein